MADIPRELADGGGQQRLERDLTEEADALRARQVGDPAAKVHVYDEEDLLRARYTDPVAKTWGEARLSRKRDRM